MIHPLTSRINRENMGGGGAIKAKRSAGIGPSQAGANSHSAVAGRRALPIYATIPKGIPEGIGVLQCEGWHVVLLDPRTWQHPSKRIARNRVAEQLSSNKARSRLRAQMGLGIGTTSNVYSKTMLGSFLGFPGYRYVSRKEFTAGFIPSVRRASISLANLSISFIVRKRRGFFRMLHRMLNKMPSK